MLEHKITTIENIFNQAFPGVLQSLENARARASALIPKATVFEDDSSFRIVFRIPAEINKDQLEVSVCAEKITLRDKGYKNEDGGTLLYDERPVLSTRTLSLYRRVKDGGYTAKFDSVKHELTVIAQKATDEPSVVAIEA
jgi:HSP20 family molecular chaperone IbpA